MLRPLFRPESQDGYYLNHPQFPFLCFLFSDSCLDDVYQTECIMTEYGKEVEVVIDVWTKACPRMVT